MNVFQRAPAIVAGMSFTMAFRLIAIGAANGQIPLQDSPANPLHRKLQQDLLSQDIFQHQSGQLVESHFRFALVDRNLFFGSASASTGL